jgi:hypothetical protein
LTPVKALACFRQRICYRSLQCQLGPAQRRNTPNFFIHCFAWFTKLDKTRSEDPTGDFAGFRCYPLDTDMPGAFAGHTDGCAKGHKKRVG